MRKIACKFKLWMIEALLNSIRPDDEVLSSNISSNKVFDSTADKKAKRILSREFRKVLTIQRQLIGRIERILISMRVTPYLLIHSVIAKCLILAEKPTKARVQTLYDQGALESAFAGCFNRFVSETGFEDFKRSSQIRELYAAELFENIGDITLPLCISNEASHHPNHMDMMFVVGIAKYRNAKKIFEFGTYLGRTTCGFASISDDVEVYTLNLPPTADPRYGPYIGNFIKKSSRQHQIKQIFCDSKSLLTESYSNLMDYIFIDADHTYDSVKNDTEKAFEMLAPGGMIIWHDFAPKSPGVYQFLYELSRQRSLFRIKNTCLVLYIDGLDESEFIPSKIEAALEAN